MRNAPGCMTVYLGPDFRVPARFIFEFIVLTDRSLVLAATLVAVNKSLLGFA